MENPRRLLSMTWAMRCESAADHPSLYVMHGLEAARVTFWAALLIRAGGVSVRSSTEMAALSDPYRVAKIGVRVLRVLAPVRSDRAAAPTLE